MQVNYDDLLKHVLFAKGIIAEMQEYITASANMEEGLSETCSVGSNTVEVLNVLKPMLAKEIRGIAAVDSVVKKVNDTIIERPMHMGVLKLLVMFDPKDITSTEQAIQVISDVLNEISDEILCFGPETHRCGLTLTVRLATA